MKSNSSLILTQGKELLLREKLYDSEKAFLELSKSLEPQLKVQSSYWLAIIAIKQNRDLENEVLPLCEQAIEDNKWL